MNNPPREPAELAAPSTTAGRLLLMAGLTFHSGRRLADHPELIAAIEDEARAAAHRPDVPGLQEAARAYLDAEAEPAYSWVIESQAARTEGRPNREVERMDRIARARVCLEESLAAANPTPEPARDAERERIRVGVALLPAMKTLGPDGDPSPNGMISRLAVLAIVDPKP